ncbi:hypothetical protein PENTCL1PPCAC_16300, partial [Pristionchus entomophagus]
ESLKPKGPHGHKGPHGEGHKGGKHASRRPPTEEEKAKFKAELAEKVAKLSPEAQEASKKIKAVFEEKKGDFKGIGKIDEITAPLYESVKKELESLKPKGSHGHKGPHGEGHRGTNGPRGSHGPRRTTASP